jgi:hypothetical protein
MTAHNILLNRVAHFRVRLSHFRVEPEVENAPVSLTGNMDEDMSG